MTANFIAALICLVVGWLALWPLRGALGATLYHLSAMPVGVLGWSFVSAVTTAVGVAPSLPLAAVSLAAYAAVIAGACLLVEGADVRPADWRGFAVFGAGYAVLAAAVSYSGLTMPGFDSYTHYELSAWYLADTGHLSSILVGSRNALVPALLMGTRLLGSDWTNVFYPLFSATTLALTGLVAYRLSFSWARPVLRWAATAGIVIVVASLTPWVFHTFFVHSNMVSAMYLTLAVVSLIVAAGAFEGERPAGGRVEALGVVAGLSLAGLSLARPDGLAYAFVGLLLAFALHLVGRITARGVVALYAALFFPTLAVYGTAIARSGLWTDAKLKASWAIAILVATALFAVVTIALPRLARRLTTALSLADVLKLLVLVDALVVAAVAVSTRDQFALTVRNMIANLFFAGNWGLTWLVVVALVGLSLLFWTRDRDEQWRALLLFCLVQYLAIGLAVHGLTHPGRVKPTDSFNRAALHIVPVAFLYVSAYLGSLMRYPRTLATERVADPASEA